MAKKKSTNQPKHVEVQIQPQVNEHISTTVDSIPAMEDQMEAIRNLKSLNSILLKETHERRVQVEDLLRAKKELEAELAAVVMEKKGLEEEKDGVETRLSELRVEVDALVREKGEVEKRFEGLKGEMEKAKSEGEFEIEVLKKKVDELVGDVEKGRGVLGRVVGERDELKRKLDVQIEEVIGLREMVVEIEGSERKMADEFEEERNLLVVKMKNFEKNVDKLLGRVEDLQDIEEELKKKVSELEKRNAEGVESRKQLLMEFTVLQEENVKNGKEIEALLNEKNLNMRSLDALEKKLEEQKQHIEGLVRDKNEIEEERNRQLMKIKEFEKQVNDLNGVIVGLQDAEARLHSKVSESEKSYAEAVESRELMLKELTFLQVKNEVSEKKIGSLLEEKNSNLQRLEVLEKKLENQKQYIEGLFRDKKEIEEERNTQVVKIKEMEKEVNKLSGTIMALRDVEVGLNSKVSELEKSKAEGVESREMLLMEFTALKEQKEETERKIETVLEEKSLILQNVEVLEKKLEDQKRLIEVIIKERSEIEAIKVCRETEIVDLQKEFGKLKDVVATLQEKCNDQEEVKNRLEHNIVQYTLQIGLITNERDDAEKGLKMEKSNAAALSIRVSEMEKKLEQSLEEMERMKMEHVNVNEAKKEAEQRCETLIGQNSNLQKKLSDTQARYESKCDSSKWVFSMLKNTAELVNMIGKMNGQEDDLLSNEHKLDEEEIHPYKVELELIKEAFKSKDAKVDELKGQLEFLQNSMVEANKKKNFWTLISSATTLFAAASVAYVARGN